MCFSGGLLPSSAVFLVLNSSDRELYLPSGWFFWSVVLLSHFFSYLCTALLSDFFHAFDALSLASLTAYGPAGLLHRSELRSVPWLLSTAAPCTPLTLPFWQLSNAAPCTPLTSPTWPLLSDSDFGGFPSSAAARLISCAITLTFSLHSEAVSFILHACLSGSLA